MRIALVSPYSWTYPGGVTRHIEALAEQYVAEGHDVRVLSPVDPDDRFAARMHRGARPAARELPEYLVSLGRTVGFPSNGAVSNVAYTAGGVSRMRRELRAGRFDVVHLHEPVALALCWDALLSVDLPLVGTFHCYSENPFSNNVANVLGARRRRFVGGVVLIEEDDAAFHDLQRLRERREVDNAFRISNFGFRI